MGKTSSLARSQAYFASLIHADADLDFAIFELLSHEPDLTPIPICPMANLPNPGFPTLTCLFGAIDDFEVGEIRELSIWQAESHAVLQYHNGPHQPVECKLLSEHSLYRGSSIWRCVGHKWIRGSSPSRILKPRAVGI